jgi:hypothetical protein
MAYNVLDGTVDYSTTQHTEIVDAHANQVIKGTKTIIGTLLSKDGREIVPPAITEIEGGSKNAILTYQTNTKAKAEFNLTFDGQMLVTKKIRAESLEGSGEKLFNLPANQFMGTIPARSINLGVGLANVRSAVQVQAAQGVSVDEKGVGIKVVPKGGLGFKNGRLAVQPKSCLNITVDGQNLSDDDMLMVHDTSRGDVRNTTLANLFDSYVKIKMPKPTGVANSVQLKGKGEFSSTPALTFDSKSNILNVDGKVIADELIVTGRTIFEGVVTQSLKTISAPAYTIEPDDYTILYDTSKNKGVATIPAACNNPGRILVIKKINSDKFKLKSNLLTVKVEEGEIDFKKSIELKMSYSTLTLQSDGKKWWIIGKMGS